MSWLESALFDTMMSRARLSDSILFEFSLAINLILKIGNVECLSIPHQYQANTSDTSDRILFWNSHCWGGWVCFCCCEKRCCIGLLDVLPFAIDDNFRGDMDTFRCSPISDDYFNWKYEILHLFCFYLAIGACMMWTILLHIGHWKLIVNNEIRR